MEKNKSIDGLTVRRAKKASSSANTVITANRRSSRSTTKPSRTNSASPVTTKPTTRKPKSTIIANPSITRSKPTTRRSKPTKSATKSTAPKINPANSKPSTTKRKAPKAASMPADIIAPIAPATPLASTDDFLSPTTTFNFDEETGKLEATDPITGQVAPDTLTDLPDDIQEDLHTPLADHPDDQISPLATSPSDQDSFLGEHPDKPSKFKKPKKVKKKMSKKRKIILGIVLSIILLLTVGCVWLILWGNDIIARITGGQGNVFDLLTFMDDQYEPLKTDENGRTNILAFGTSGYNMEGDEGNGTHDGAQLTDSIMVISLDQETGDIAMLSLPRDLKVSRTCTATGKVNEIYWCNNMEGDNEQAGAEAIMDEVGEILGIDFQYFAHLNWGSLVQIVDTLGGINVTLDEGIYDYYYTKAVFEPGVEYTIDGAEALGLARARHGTESGDFSRGASQQKILIGIKNKLHDKNLSITDLTDLAGTLGDNLRTNFNVEELKTIANIISTQDLSSIRQISLIDPEPLMTTGSINGISYVLPTGGAGYYTKIQDYVDKMFSSDPRDRENASILVLNGTDTPGLASTEEDTLTEDGYDNIDIDDAPLGTYDNQYTLYYLSDTAPETLKLLESKYNTTALSSDDLPAGINTNYDFVLILGEAQAND